MWLEGERDPDVDLMVPQRRGTFPLTFLAAVNPEISPWRAAGWGLTLLMLTWLHLLPPRDPPPPPPPPQKKQPIHYKRAPT